MFFDFQQEFNRLSNIEESINYVKDSLDKLVSRNEMISREYSSKLHGLAFSLVAGKGWLMLNSEKDYNHLAYDPKTGALIFQLNNYGQTKNFIYARTRKNLESALDDIKKEEGFGW